jgi:hypothetical protein
MSKCFSIKETDVCKCNEWLYYSLCGDSGLCNGIPPFIDMICV